MKKRLLLTFLFVVVSVSNAFVKAQVFCSTSLGTLSPGTTWQTIQHCNGGNYAFTTQAGCQYQFTYCANGGSYSGDPYLTISTSPTGSGVTWNDDWCGVGSQITWTAPSSATYYIHVANYGGSCSTGCRTLAYWSSCSSGPPTPSISGPTAACIGSSVTLTASNTLGTTYWYSGTCGGTQLGTGTTISVSPTANTTYFARNFNNNTFGSCASYTVQALTAPTVSGTTTVTCGQTTTLTGSGGTNMVWYAANTGGTPLSNNATLTTGALTGDTAFYIGTGGSNATVTGFTSCYAPTNWTTNHSNGGNGSINSGGAPTSIVLTGPNGTGSNSYTYYTITAPVTTTISFSWSVQHSDPGYDGFGYSIGGTNTQLTAGSASGNVSVNVNAGQTFAFYGHSFDGCCGTFNATISNFSATCPGSGCIATVPVLVTPLTAPTVTANGPTTFCIGNNVTLSSSATAGHLWNNGATSQTVTTNVNDTLIARYITGACTSSASTPVIVVVNPLPTAPVISAIGTTVFCQGDSVEVSSSLGMNTVWNNGDTGTTTWYYLAGNATATITDGNGCTSIASNSVPINVLNSPASPTINPSGNQSICQGNTLTAQTNFSNGVVWNDGTLGGINTISQPGTYTAVLIDNNGCSSLPSAPLNVALYANPSPPIVTPIGSTLICTGTQLALVSSYSFGNTWNVPGQTGDTLFASQPGNYTATHTDTNGCTSQASFPVTVNNLPQPAAPVISATGSISFCAGGSVQLNSNYANNNTWSNGSSTASIVVNTQNSYTAIFTDGNGCNSLPSNAIQVVVNPLPIISSISTPTACVGSAVQLNNGSAVSNTNNANITLYSWNFGDGNMSVSGPQPTHTYTAAGNYNVQLQVTTNHGCTAQSSSSILVNPQPIINSLTIPAVCVGQTSQFGQSSSVQNFNGATIQQYHWNFGDGNTGNGIAPSHTYVGEGAYNTSLSVTTNHGCSNTLSQQVLVNPNPVVTSVSNTIGCQGGSSVFNATGNVSNTNGSSISTYTWNFGDGNTAVGGANQTHTYAGFGNYVVTLTIGSNNGCTGTGTAQATINPAPIISNMVLVDACLGNTSVGGASYSIPPLNNSIISHFDWDLGDGNFGTNPTYNHVYAQEGNYTVSVTVTSNLGCNTTLTGNTWVNANPVINSVSASDACQNSAALFSQTASVNATNNAQISAWQWQFGDGATGSGANPSYSYPGFGPFNYTLTVSTQYGCTDVATGSITIHPQPVVDFQYSSLCLQAGAQFQSNSTIPLGSITQYQWNFGDGAGIAQGLNPFYQYSSSGVYNATLTAISDQGCSQIKSNPVLINDGPSSNFSAGFLGPFTMQFIPVIAEPAWNHFWDFGDGNTSTSVLPTHTYSNPGTYQICLTLSQGNCTSQSCSQIQLNTTGGIAVDGISGRFTVFPNPVNQNTQLGMDLGFNSTIRLALRDVSGRVLYNAHLGNFEVGNHTVEIGSFLSNLPAAVYLLEVSTERGTEMIRIVKGN